MRPSSCPICLHKLQAFNRGVWKNLEAVVRNWAITEVRIYVVTAGILTASDSTIGANEVTVPSQYYKVIYDPTGMGKMIALILPNEKGTKKLEEYVVSVDYIENLTRIDFFPSLEDSVENQLEGGVDISKWSFSK